MDYVSVISLDLPPTSSLYYVREIICTYSVFSFLSLPSLTFLPLSLLFYHQYFGYSAEPGFGLSSVNNSNPGG